MLNKIKPAKSRRKQVAYFEVASRLVG